MHPILFRLGSLQIHTYGVLVAGGFLAGLLLAQHRARREGIDPILVSDLGVWLIVAAMLGAKLFHIVFFWTDFIDGLRTAGLVSLRAGFVFYGGFVSAAITVVLYSRHKRLPLARVADVFAPALPLGHALGRLGCFFEGCCYGKVCSLPWAVRFPLPEGGVSLRLHPTQLYEAAGNLALFGALCAFDRHTRFAGQLGWWYIIGYGTLRFFVEFFRGDYIVHYFGVFTIAQILAVILVGGAVVGHEWSRRRLRRLTKNP